MTDEIRVAANFYPSGQGIARLGEAQERQVRQVVEGIVRRARLWRSEQNEVRMELLDHFDDGADAGRSVEQLLADFGPPHLAARLIRTAKLRNRSWRWHLWHRFFQIATVSVSLVLGCVLILLARLHLASPGQLTDIVGDLDRTNAKLAANDRGWPDYREGLILLERKSLTPDSELQKFLLGHPTGPGNPHWNQVVEYLDANAKSVDLFVKGSEHSRLGFLYRDVANDPWLAKLGGRGSVESYKVHTPIDEVLLSQYQDLGNARTLLFVAALRALEKQDLLQFRKYWQAESDLANQMLADSEFPIVDSFGQVCAGKAMELLRRLAGDYAGLLSDEELAAWRRELSTAKWKSSTFTVPKLRIFFDDILKTYAPEASGGRFSAEACRTLRRKLSYVAQDVKWPMLLVEKQRAGLPDLSGVPYHDPTTVTEALYQESTAIRWATTLADRRELSLEFERLLALLQTELDKPLATSKDFEGTVYLRELDRLATTPELYQRYWPVLLILPVEDYVFWPERGRETQQMTREATQAAFALEQYRRRTGNWPERLEQLVPADLPRVPIDAYSGRPLIYRVADGKPLLYSVFQDRDDNGGKPYPTPSFGNGPYYGDLKLLPVE